LSRSVFEVLSKMADSEEFYALYHSIYGKPKYY